MPEITLTEWLSTTLLVALLAMAALLLHKVRKVHLATYDPLADSKNTRKQTDALFSQIQALLALERKLELPEALPPLRGWAASPDFLLRIANEIQARKPVTVMECSSGVSTVVAARCLQMNGAGYVFSLEHDPEYANATRKLLDRYGLAEWATVLDAPLQSVHTHTPWYSEDTIPQDLDPIEMLIVDGPPSTVAPLARFPAIPRFITRMATNALVIMDDSDRDDEVEIVNRYKKIFPDLRYTDGYCEKGCALFELRPIIA